MLSSVLNNTLTNRYKNIVKVVEEISNKAESTVLLSLIKEKKYHRVKILPSEYFMGVNGQFNIIIDGIMKLSAIVFAIKSRQYYFTSTSAKDCIKEIYEIYHLMREGLRELGSKVGSNNTIVTYDDLMKLSFELLQDYTGDNDGVGGPQDFIMGSM